MKPKEYLKHIKHKYGTFYKPTYENCSKSCPFKAENFHIYGNDNRKEFGGSICTNRLMKLCEDSDIPYDIEKIEECMSCDNEYANHLLELCYRRTTSMEIE